MEYEYNIENADKDLKTKQEKENKKRSEKGKELSTEDLLLKIINRLDKLEAQYEAGPNLARSSLANHS